MLTTSLARSAAATDDDPGVGAAPAAAATVGRSGPALAGAVLGYLLVVTFVITLAPFELHRQVVSPVRLDEWAVLDVVANVLLFLPLGFLYAQLRGARSGTAAKAAVGPRAGSGGRVLVQALLLGMGASALIELLQLWIPQRYPSPWDVLSNGAGAAVGAAAYDRLRRRFDPARLVGRLGLELPLMGLVYLLVPLGWLDALSVRGAPERWWLLLCLGLFGGSVLGAAQRQHFGPAGLFSARGMAAAAGGWFVLCGLPALTTAPLAVAGTALVVAVLTWVRARAASAAADRRFELTTLLRAAPYFAAYLLLLALSAPETDAVLRRSMIFQTMETMAAFTLLGYMTAEAQGRRELRFRAVLPLVALVAVTVALALAAARTAGAPTAGELPALATAAVAGVYGGWLYHLQRAQVRAIVRGAAAAQLPGVASSLVVSRGTSADWRSRTGRVAPSISTR